MSTIDRAAAALSMTVAVLADFTVGVARRQGFTVDYDAFEALPQAKQGEVKVGDLVVVYSHQRYRVATVWAVKASKLSAVYTTPSAIDEAARYNRSISPNTITARIADCANLLGEVAGDELVPVSNEEAPGSKPHADEPVTAGIATQPAEVAVGDDAYRAGMLPLAGGDGFLF